MKYRNIKSRTPAMMKIIRIMIHLSTKGYQTLRRTLKKGQEVLHLLHVFLPGYDVEKNIGS
jgi:hypothetical protein